MRIFVLGLLVFLVGLNTAFSQDHSENNGDGGTEAVEGDLCSRGNHSDPYDPSEVALHHISDQNVYSIGDLIFIPLPCILYTPGRGFSFFSSGRFDVGHHGNGSKAIDRYVLDGGIVKRVTDPVFPSGEVEIDCFIHEKVEVDGKEKEVFYVAYQGRPYQLDAKTTWDGGLIGGGITSFYDFSITKNVITMILMALFLGWVFISCAGAYKKRDKQAPRGLQSFMEIFFLFIQDEVAKPVVGPKYERYMPFLMSLFFFILALNLIGQVPFLGNPNVMGNVTVTTVLAILTFIITNFSGKKNYWQHIFWMPGVPWMVKLILTPIEILGLFLKPFTLLIRLFANITAGHIVVLSFVGLIFIFGQSGENIGGSIGGIIGATLLTLFMSCIELLIAFIQAFIFAILSASYIGAAIEEHH